MSETELVDDGVMALARLEESREELAVIASAEQAQDAGYYLRAVRQSMRTIKADYKARRANAEAEVKRLRTEEERRLRPFSLAETQVDIALTAWRIAEKRQVEAQRAAQLSQARAEEALKRAAAVAELEAQAKTAKGLDKTILKGQARALSLAPLTPTISVPMVQETKIAGVALIEYWHAEVTDLALLVQAVAQGRAPLSALQGNLPWLNEQAKSLGKELSYPGVVAVSEFGQTARGL